MAVSLSTVNKGLGQGRVLPAASWSSRKPPLSATRASPLLMGGLSTSKIGLEMKGLQIWFYFQPLCPRLPLLVKHAGCLSVLPRYQWPGQVVWPEEKIWVLESPSPVLILTVSQGSTHPVLLHSILLCFLGVALFLQIKGKTLHDEKDLNSMTVVWN